MFISEFIGVNPMAQKLRGNTHSLTHRYDDAVSQSFLKNENQIKIETFSIL